MNEETAQAILGALKEAGVNFVVYMPDSFFFEVITKAKDDPSLTSISVPNESTGVCVCAGAWLGGKKPVMIMENTGLFVASNVITRFHQAFGIPFLMLISYRGDIGDGWWFVTPIGHAFVPTLKSLSIPYEIVDNPEDACKAIKLLQNSASVSDELEAVVFRKEGRW